MVYIHKQRIDAVQFSLDKAHGSSRFQKEGPTRLGSGNHGLSRALTPSGEVLARRDVKFAQLKENLVVPELDNLGTHAE